MTKKDILQFMLAREFLKGIGGDESIILVKHCLKRKKHITDEYLAKKMKMKVTEIRTILNRLHFMGISIYNKTKNTKTGWYNYTWDIKTQRIAELIVKQESEKIQKMLQTQEMEKNYMYFGCKKEHELMQFEIAAEYEFKCPECGEKLEAINNEKRLKETGKRIETMQIELEELKQIY